MLQPGEPFPCQFCGQPLEWCDLSRGCACKWCGRLLILSNDTPVSPYNPWPDEEAAKEGQVKKEQSKKG